MVDAAPLVRFATDGDASRIAEIYAHHVLYGLASFEEQPPDAAEMARRRAVVVGAGFPYVVIEVGGRVEGYAYANQYRPRPGYRYTVENSVYVAADAGGRGYGAILLRQVIDDCTRLGYRQMIAVIGDSANEASIRLHRRLGFEHAGVLRDVGFKLGRWVDSVYMTRTLGEGSQTLPPDKTQQKTPQN